MIIGISGHAQAGKDTLGGYLITCLKERHKRGFVQSAFATQLKTMCTDHFGLTQNQLWGDKKEEKTEFKKPNYTRAAAVEYADGRGLPPWYWTPREIMQELGSFYRSIDFDFWVKALDKYLMSNDIKDAIITDVRYVNECEYVKKNKGILIRIIRGDTTEIHGMCHESETALDGKPSNYFDLTVINDRGLKELKVVAEESSDMIINLENLINNGRIV